MTKREEEEEPTSEKMSENTARKCSLKELPRISTLGSIVNNIKSKVKLLRNKSH